MCIYLRYCDGIDFLVFFFQAVDGIRDGHVTGVQTCALPIFAEACRGPILPGYAYGDLLAADALRERTEPWVGFRPAVPSVASVDRLEDAGQLDADAYDIVVRCGDLEFAFLDRRAVLLLTHGPTLRRRA